ncbi:hypothetical protein [Streptomyces sp. JJ36]|uniref:baeRF2 domain-containing protein n=1 Tax=Streptomyces sp. JJ36 TaxID=2736645 RepID=UPI001F3477E4|nr:hypothetical protein [Streptomyces sp. JJ36]MCF6521650.1 hypothetical protein [Streptomyces sp. JJ36]
MELSSLAALYAEEEPFATVYLEGRSPGEDAADQVRLRWENLRGRLAADGATEAALAAIDEALSREKAGEEQTDGRVLVASGSGRLALDEPWDASLGAGDGARWGPLPELGPYVRQAAEAARVLLVVAAQEDAQVSTLTVTADHHYEELAQVSFQGSAAEGPHHPREGALSHRQIQRRADEAVKQNAKDIAAALTDLSGRHAPDLVVLAGEVQGRSALRSQLPAALPAPVAETDRGGAVDDRAREALDEEVLRLVTEHVEQRLADNASRLREAQGHDNAVEGGEQLLQAAGTGALETLVLEAGTAADHEARLLQGAAQSGTTLELVPHGTGLKNGSAGILRFSPRG